MTKRPDDVDEQIEEINDAVDDGSGCAETWETLSGLRNGDGVQRRGFIKMGAASVSLAMLGTTPALASTPDEEPSYDELNGTAARRVLAKFQQADEFKQLRKRAHERGGELKLDSTLVGRVENEKTLEIVSVPIETAESDRGYLTMGRIVEAGQISIAELEYINDTNERVPKDATKIDATEGYEVSTYGGTPLESVDAISVQSDEITTQDFDLGCWGCKKCFELICQIGCGASTAFICGVLSGAGYIAGGACFAFTQIACRIIADKGCGGQFDYEDLCSDPRLNLC